LLVDIPDGNGNNGPESILHEYEYTCLLKALGLSCGRASIYCLSLLRRLNFETRPMPPLQVQNSPPLPCVFVFDGRAPDLIFPTRSITSRDIVSRPMILFPSFSPVFLGWTHPDAVCIVGSTYPVHPRPLGWVFHPHRSAVRSMWQARGK